MARINANLGYEGILTRPRKYDLMFQKKLPAHGLLSLSQELLSGVAFLTNSRRELRIYERPDHESAKACSEYNSNACYCPKKMALQS